MSLALRPSIVRDLFDLLGPQGVTGGPLAQVAYESDGFALVRGDADLVVLPRTTREAALAMQLLYEAGVAVVPRGAGTGLTGGASPTAGGVVFGTARMRRILELDPAHRFARVEAGVVNSDLSRAAAPHGLFYAPDPSSQASCTIGGNVANNSGGPHCFKYGSTSRHVLGLKVVLPDGEVLDLSEPREGPDGLDLVGFFVGSEGTLGVATEVTVRLTPLPQRTETMLAMFRSLDEACDSVSAIIAARLRPSAIEILDKLTIEAVEASVFRAGYPKDVEAVLLMDVDGDEVDVVALCKELEQLVTGHGGYDLRRASTAAERAALWAGRKGAFGAMGRIAPDLYVADAVVPRTKLRELIAYATQVCRERGLKLANVFHAGDGNLHPNICYDRRDSDEVARVLDAGDRILSRCIELGGSLSGEHGIGIEKRDHMCDAFDQASLDAMAAVRRAWDPDGRMNPTKLLPTRACLEIHTRPIPITEVAT